ncbi:hypothetical protein EVAR_101688_1 [Eumeta japonica]|uniref:Uncharacterized protein n=1 Tax=Eumeta variegata TaxID=151549 RepID=A0A4C1SJ89_EUMVA|nr:hypothetical protein EVAR_101688_1 [Eumeta japonica]
MSLVHQLSNDLTQILGPDSILFTIPTESISVDQFVSRLERQPFISLVQSGRRPEEGYFRARALGNATTGPYPHSENPQKKDYDEAVACENQLFRGYCSNNNIRKGIEIHKQRIDPKIRNNRGKIICACRRVRYSPS